MTAVAPPVGRRGVAHGLVLAGAGALAGVVAVVAGQHGMIGLVAVAVVAVAAVAAVVGRAHLRPLRPGALLGAGSRPAPGHPAPVAPDRLLSALLLALAIMAAGTLAVAAAMLGVKGAMLLVALLAGATICFLYRAEIGLVVFGHGKHRGTPLWAQSPLFEPVRKLHPPESLSAPLAVMVAVAAVAGAGVLAWLGASLGMKGPILLIGLVAVVAFLVFVRPRADALLFILPCSLVLFLHKSFTPLHLVNSGAPAIYITSVGVLLIVLYGVWAAEGTMRADLRVAFRRPILWIPLVGAVVLLPSILAATDVTLSMAELVRMAWMYLLYVYVAVRVRRHTQVLLLLTGLGIFAVVEFVVVVLQWKTGGVLGLSFLGVPTELGERVINDGSLGRPFGTIVHPVFMGATMGALGLLFLGVGLSVRELRLKLASLALVPVCLIPLFLAHTRAAAIAFLPVALAVVVTSAVQGRISTRSLKQMALVGLVAAAVLYPVLSKQFSENFSSDHFSVEVESRVQLNDLALNVIADHPETGVGLNNFQAVQDRYHNYGLLFAGNPVHNLYLLQTAETGYLGLAGLLLVGAGLLLTSWRLARSRDPLLGGLGTGVTAVVVFFAIEELLGFSLRQEIPLALWWLLAGMAVAGTAMTAERIPPRPPASLRVPRPGGGSGRDRMLVGAGSNGHGSNGQSSNGHRRSGARWRLPRTSRRRLGRIGAAMLVACVLSPWPTSAGAGANPLAAVRIVFAATDETVGGNQGVFVANGDGSGITRVTPNDGLFYDFPSWAMGGTKIVFSKRDGGPGTPENLYLMNADGSGVQALTRSPWRNHQPKVSADGRRVIFSGFVPGTRLVAIYQIDLDTLLVRNLSAVHSHSVMADADPKYTADGRSIAFARSRDDQGDAKTQVYLMNADGTGRYRVTNDGWYDVDPEVSPDSRSVAFSSYRGPGTPQQEGREFDAKSQDFYLGVRDLATGTEQTLTGGENCAARDPNHPCLPSEGSAYVPVWSPDGGQLGYITALDSNRTCLCVMARNGSNAHAVIARPGLSMTWFDWVIPGQAPDTAVTDIGGAKPADRMLVAGTQTASESDPASRPILEVTTRDLWDRTEVPIPGGLNPRFARWNADRSTVVFSSVVPGDVPRPEAPPVPPAGQRRHEHFTLADLDAVFHPPVVRPEVAREQVFVSGAQGVFPLTNPGTEDWHDGIVAGDLRGNTEPDISPDGRYVVTTNVSSVTNESFLLRIDLVTGERFNLTNATSGAMPVDDAQPRFSPDGQSLAFTSSFEGHAGVYVMDAATGLGVRSLTEDDFFNTAPAWSPDGRSIVYASYRGDTLKLLQSLALPAEAGTIPRGDWYLVRVDVATGAEQVITAAAASPTLAPAWSPDGSEIAYISTTDGFQPDVYVVSATGGASRPLQITGLTQEHSVDWK